MQTSCVPYKLWKFGNEVRHNRADPVGLKVCQLRLAVCTRMLTQMAEIYFKSDMCWSASSEGCMPWGWGYSREKHKLQRRVILKLQSGQMVADWKFPFLQELHSGNYSGLCKRHADDNSSASSIMIVNEVPYMTPQGCGRATDCRRKSAGWE